MTAEPDKRVVDLRRLRRSCGECSLRALCLPAGIARKELVDLDAVVRARVPLDRGEALFRNGDSFESLYVIRSGCIRTAQPSSEGEEQIIGFHIPGELVGLDAISDDQHHCDAIALERTSVCAVPFDRLQEIAGRIPALQRQLHRIISREMVRDHHHLVALGRRTARERLALFLQSLSERLELAGYPGDELLLSMSREDIANYLGLALETVSRLMSRLHEEGIVSVNRRHVTILDPVRLAENAGRPRAAARSDERRHWTK